MNAKQMVAELRTDLEAHEKQESSPVEMRNRRGSWEDVADRVAEIEAVMLETRPDLEIGRDTRSVLRLGRPSAGTINAACDRAVSALESLRDRFPGIEGIVFSFNDTDVEVRPGDRASKLVDQYWTKRERG